MDAMDANGLRERIQTFLRARPDLNVDHLTAHTALAQSTGRGFLNGTIPRCDSDRVRSELERVLSLAERGEILAPGRNAIVLSDAPAPGQRVRRIARRQNFYQIATVRRVAEVLDYCAERAAIGVITGDYGIGKTEAVKAWRSGAGAKTESAVIEFDGFTSGNRAWFLESLVEQLGLPPANAPRMFRSVCDYLRASPMLLVFDHCEIVTVRMFQLLRQVWDRTHEAGAGMVLLAAPPLLNRMLSSRIADLGALTSRVGVWAPLAGVSRGEMAQILKQEGIADIDEAAFEIWYKATGGSMRRLMRAIELIQAKHAGKRVTAKTI